MHRRTFLVIAAGTVLAWAHAGQAQPPAKTARIGYLSIRSGPTSLDEAFQQGMRELGYVEGQNLSVEYRWAEWKPERFAPLAEELVRLRVDVIVSTGGIELALAVKKAVQTTPVVFAAGDPVTTGLVARLDRPGGNLTGVNLATSELNPKRLELLRAAVPGVSRVAVLANPSATADKQLKDIEEAGRLLSVKLQVVSARNPHEIDTAFVTMTKERAGALLVMANPMFLIERDRIVRLAATHRLPGIFEQAEFADAGGLMSYGTNFAGMYRRLATYVDKILKGARPGDLPVEQPTTFELVINLKTAKALGLTIPQSLLHRADRVVA
jgi:putative ABC transport system substrate-binding protein